MPVTACSAPAEQLRGATPSPRRKGRIRRANEAEILRAAEGVFARAGFGGATMAEIARQAGVTKPSLHYYFGTKQAVYRAVLEQTLGLWLAETDTIRPEVHPEVALGRYIRAKMTLATTHPDASRVFANEVIHGASEIGDYLRTDLKALVTRKAEVFEHWASQGLMDPVDARHWFFTVWAATQTYADFQVQVCAVLDQPTLTAHELRAATDQLVRIVLRGCGVRSPQ